MTKGEVVPLLFFIMKIVKAIKFHRKLIIRQEYLCYKVCQYSQRLLSGQSPYFNEFRSINKAVRNVEKKLPYLYFLLSDLLGGAISLKKESKIYIKEQEEVKFDIICWDLIPFPDTPNIYLK